MKETTHRESYARIPYRLSLRHTMNTVRILGSYSYKDRSHLTYVLFAHTRYVWQTVDVVCQFVLSHYFHRLPHVCSFVPASVVSGRRSSTCKNGDLNRQNAATFTVQISLQNEYKILQTIKSLVKFIIKLLSS